MTNFINLKKRKSIRLKDYEYSRPRAYFITICVKDKECIFGKVLDKKMKISDCGALAHRFWFQLPKKFSHIRLDKFVVMPNHVHGILIIQKHPVRYKDSLDQDNPGAMNHTPTLDLGQRHIYVPLGEIVRSYKSVVTRNIRKLGHDYFRWQPGFFDRILTNNLSLKKIQHYIITNPTNWEKDEENPNFNSKINNPDGVSNVGV
jgi:REP element-mobilizing transposase RayT